MGLRFRKSIHLGGGFNINLSKSGIGYSWGTKGARITKTAKGTNRTTLSVPGTGISYVSETSGKKKAPSRSSKTQKSTYQHSANYFYNSPNNQDNQEGKDPTMKKLGKSGKNVVLWIMTVFFALTFLVYIPHIASFIALAVAVLLAPIQKWQSLLGKYVRGKIKTIVAVVLVILTFATIPTTETPDSDIPLETTTSVTDETTEATQETTITTEATTESTTEPTTEPTTKPATESTKEPTTESTTEPTTAPTAEPPEDNGRDYVLNTNTMKFHYPSCGSADDIQEANKAYYHGTREELIAKGYSPCGRCHP